MMKKKKEKEAGGNLKETHAKSEECMSRLATSTPSYLHDCLWLGEGKKGRVFRMR